MNTAVLKATVRPLFDSGRKLGSARPWRGGFPAVRRLLSFMGPGYLIAVGYMDPGNWATSLAGGSTFGYSLLSVLLLSNVMAMLLQTAAVRLGVATGQDLAQVCRHEFGERTNLLLWVGCEIAIVACNLAEVLGMACGLNLLFHIPLTAGVVITALDVLLLLTLQRRGVRYLEALVIALVTLIGVCFALELWWLRPSAGAVLAGFVPSRALWHDSSMLYLAIGIVGATVMPHNLYLHSSIVQSRRRDHTEAGLQRTARYATIDSNVALGFALLINIGIMVVAATAFHAPHGAGAVDLTSAYQLLTPLLGSAASLVFGIGLLASGLSSSITGTLAGQVVMEGFLRLKIAPARRAMLTRGLALVPAALVAGLCGASGVGKLLVLSQFILGIQLPFAVIPLLWFTTRRRYLGVHAFGAVAGAFMWASAAFIVGLNCWVIWGAVA